MIRFKYILIYLALVVSASLSYAQNNLDYMPGELIVMIEKNITVGQFEKSINTNHPSINLNVKSVISNRLNIWLFQYNEMAISHSQALEIVNTSKWSVIAQSNHTNLTLRGDTCPDEFSFGLQWNMRNTGQSGGTPGADIQSCEAWGLNQNITTANGDTLVVAVIDDGFFLGHQDINYFKNRSEIPNNGIDDDGNGYIDDYDGWNSRNNNDNITSQRHGTMVAGVVGAKADLVGVAGVHWGVKVLPIQGSSTQEATVLRSYNYALEMRIQYDSSNGSQGAFVVATNSSFGVDFANRASYPLWCAFYDSLGARGILSATATANRNVNVDVSGDMPTTCESDFMIAVTNTNRFDGKANSAGFGATHIDIGAPGSTIRSTAPYSGTYSSAASYSTADGTSFSTPHVAGAISFLYASACQKLMNEYQNDPAATALKIKDILLESGDSISGLLGITTTGKRLNLYNATLAVQDDKLCKNPDTITNNVILGEGITLYPNPNNGDFDLRFYRMQQENYSSAIFSSTGQLVSEQNFNVESDNQVFDVNFFNTVSSGVYILCLKSDSGFTKNIKFVITR